MKKSLFYSAALLTALTSAAFITASCGDDDDDVVISSSADDDDDDDSSNSEFDEAADLDITSDNLSSWKNYAYQVAKLLEEDANSLYYAWNTYYDYNDEAFAITFKNHNNTNDYSSALDCIYTIIDYCVDITDEVGNSKIGDPYNEYMAGNYTEALYAVESWYSWHSRDDYANNIRSIRNSYYSSLDSTVNDASLYTIVENLDPTLNAQVAAAIEEAKDAILAIPQPFRNNIDDATVPVAQQACLDLGELFDEDVRAVIRSAYSTNQDADELDAAVTTYVDEVVVPTYKSLSEKNADLCDAVEAFYNNPTDEAIEEACDAWLVAREPWEKSEAFLFGPVDELGLDPNMDSWPLDQVAIVNILESGNYDDLNWSDEDSDEDIEASQEVRGFHTLEFLLFKDGEPRTITE